MRLQGVIEEEATKLIRRWERYAQSTHDEIKRRGIRSGIAGSKFLDTPEYWDLAPGFNPYLVRSRAERIARAIEMQIRSRTYVPRPGVVLEVPKAGQEPRRVCIFQVADAALSRLVFLDLIAKNQSKFSAYAFAYRSDITIHDAVRHIALDVDQKLRLFIAEYDFKKYFDTIAHDHLDRILTDERFLFTERERFIVRQFLKSSSLDREAYEELGAQARTEGIPQGTSISLFLANASAWPLDRGLERIGVGFARYADDTLIWSNDYSKVSRSVDFLHDMSKAMGVNINLKKSPGISIFSPPNARTELTKTSTIEFIGYRFSARDADTKEGPIGIRDSTVKRITERISEIIYQNLLEQPRHGVFNAARVKPHVDRDYVVTIFQIRRYLYGGLSEPRLERYLRKSAPRIHYRGVMAFYPLVNDFEQLRELDGWLLRNLWSTLNVRKGIWLSHDGTRLPMPHGLTKEELVEFQGKSLAGDNLDLRLPSFVRMGKLLEKVSTEFGPNAIAHRRSNMYYGRR